MFTEMLVVMIFVGDKRCGLVYIGQKGVEKDYESSLVEWVQLRSLEVPGSNLGTETGYPV
jgi:hypothetical protein